MDEYAIIKYPVTTEKAVRLMQDENKLTFIVDRKSKKTEIKEALEKLKSGELNETSGPDVGSKFGFGGNR